MPSQQRQENSKSQERHPAAPGKPRSDQHQRSPQESRRKRGEPRPSSWGDDVDRAWCIKAITFLPETFPVESHAGVATIPPTIVDRREQMILVCNHSHSGEHAWPGVIALIRGGDGPPEGDDPQT